MSGSQRPVFASDDWMHEQQMRAELEAEAWRRLRHELAAPPPVQTATLTAQANPHQTGSTILKAVVRFTLAAFGAYLAYLAAVDSQLGEFEVWLAVGATFAVTLALTMFGPMRRFVHTLAETTRWMLLVTIGFGAVWMITHYAV
jgi:hypothetical protein